MPRGENKLTKEQFVQRANKLHNNKYNYDKTVYKNFVETCTITCPLHGDFQQKPREHLSGNGCHVCAFTSRVEKSKNTIQDFISRSTIVHSDKYDYKKFVYINTNTKGIITCPEHGDFLQSPKSHMNGNGCLLCSGKYKKTLEEFISISNKKHNNKYDYKKFVYINNNTKGIITCPLHGDFLQSPKQHMKGNGCSVCSFEKLSSLFRSNTEEFIKKSVLVHNGKYDYSKTNYINSTTPVMITCPKHGDFEQNVNNHLNGAGCKKCAIEKIANLFSDTKEDFIRKSNITHNNKYDYSKANYINSFTKVEIICPFHGSFVQKPTAHINGNRCPKCKRSKGEIMVEQFLLDNNIKFYTEYPIPGCERKFRYDFYLPEHNMFIEFHGGQHYQFVKYFHKDQDGFLNQKFRDSLKKDLARLMGYKLVVVHYRHLRKRTLNSFLLKKIRSIS